LGRADVDVELCVPRVFTELDELELFGVHDLTRFE
jgi:hypothetical protein